MNETTKNSKENQSGQTLIEFILLLAVIVIISFTFTSGVNTAISQRWQALANIVLDDNNQNLVIQ